MDVTYSSSYVHGFMGNSDGGALLGALQDSFGTGTSMSKFVFGVIGEILILGQAIISGPQTENISIVIVFMKIVVVYTYRICHDNMKVFYLFFLV